MSVKARLQRLEVKAAARMAPLYLTTLSAWLNSLCNPSSGEQPLHLSAKLAKRLSIAMAAPDDPMEAA